MYFPLMAVEIADISYRENIHHSRFLIEVESDSAVKQPLPGSKLGLSGSSTTTQSNMALISKLQFGRARSQHCPQPPPLASDPSAPGFHGAETSPWGS